jgi:hypothetical protein
MKVCFDLIPQRSLFICFARIDYLYNRIPESVISNGNAREKMLAGIKCFRGYNKKTDYYYYPPKGANLMLK